MYNTFKYKLVKRLIDWLFVFLGVTIILWFVLTQPVFSLSPQPHSTSNSVSTGALKTHVEELVTHLAPRTLEYGLLKNTAKYIHGEFAQVGNAQYQPYWTTLGGRFYNVLLELGPNTQERMVIGAHYDAASNDLNAEGNASGIAVLLELAKLLSKNADKLPIKVQLIAYPLSQSFKSSVENMGSYQHAALLKSSHKKVKLMVSLDSVGHFSSERQSQKYPYKFLGLFYPSKGNYLSVIGRVQEYTAIRHLKKSFLNTSSLPLYSFNVPDNFTVINSYDHLNYQNKGFPALLITDTGKYRHISSPQEATVIEQLDYENMARLVESLYAAIIKMKPSEEKQNNLLLSQKTRK